MSEIVHLAGARVSVVLEVGDGVPVVRHWGAPLGDVDGAALVFATERAVPPSAIVEEAPLSLVPEHAAGFPGHPGLTGARLDGSAWAPRFSAVGHEAGAHHLRTVAADPTAGLELVCEVRLDPASDVVLVQVTLTNLGDEYRLDGLLATVPLPAPAAELMTFGGRWTEELQTSRVAWASGAVVAENRRGRTSHDHPPALFAGTSGFGESDGEVWAVQIGWSGNHVLRAERLADGRRYLQAGELLLAGEVTLAAGESYATPWLYFARGVGLNAVSQAFHRHLRRRPGQPGQDRPRPVVANTWEAVYFDHDRSKLFRLAERAAAVGAERFVLDDGWFHDRRDDTAGLGDWWVDTAAHPGGLGPLIDHVHALGMDFGLWVEPEMVNPNSELYRAHPEWVLTDHAYEPVLSRHQLVLDLVEPAAFAHVLGQLDALLSAHQIAYLKWDMNRDLVHASHGRRAAVHGQTLAAYRLLDELRAHHPGLEIESCASGGGRADLEILRRTCRIWPSDTNDALDRQAIQRGFSYLFPPEVMGAHIGPPRSHTTGRRHRLAFRAATALFGHLGIEWNLLEADEHQLAQLAEVVALHRRFRHLLHTGDVVRFDVTDPSTMAHGVYAEDRSEALVAVVQRSSPAGAVPDALCIPDLHPDRTYEVRPVPLPGEVLGLMQRRPAWFDDGGVAMTGRQLGVVGLAMPALLPESVLVVHVTRR